MIAVVRLGPPMSIQSVRLFVAAVSISFGTGVFWAFLASELVRHLFGLNENKAFIFLGGPLFIIYFIWCCRVLPGILVRNYRA
ncbi:hypothetical protein BCEN4_270010 [Burkholderia cenocepacia]|nr:hypothetical protein BCEN4_270010 [Burkholderia cenocepacia]